MGNAREFRVDGAENISGPEKTESMLMASTREGKVTCSRKLNVMWHTHPEEGLRVEVLSRVCFFFYLRLLRRCRGIFFLLSLFFLNIFCCFVCLICVCEGYTWKVSSSCHQKLEPMFGEEGRAIHAVHGMAPRLQQQHFNNSNSFL